MAIERINSKTVVQNNGIARKKQFLCKDYLSALRSVHHGSGGRWEIYSRVGRTGLSIQNTPLAKISPFGVALQWNSKRAIPQLLRSRGIKDSSQPLALPVRSLHLIRARFDELLLNFQSLSGESALSYRDGPFAAD